VGFARSNRHLVLVLLLAPVMLLLPLQQLLLSPLLQTTLQAQEGTDHRPRSHADPQRNCVRL
jgi:hypothetical protein